MYLNQVGYVPGSSKKATVLKSGKYQVVDTESGKVAATFDAVEFGMDQVSGDHCYTVDLSSVAENGKYRLVSEDGQTSDTFEISGDVYGELQKALVKCLYFQRCGIALEEQYAGPYTHAVCHNEPAILLQDYLDKTENPKTFEVSGGWHDAGDFGRYISPAGVAVGHLLYAYEMFPDAFNEEINIPESGNGVPDVLNETRYELDWMLKMQREDGGVYHKLTAFRHADFIMPEFDKDPFILYPVSSMATADFAASMAIASRVYRAFDPVFADTALQAARKAFEWLKKNPEYLGFENPDGCNTGQYEDASDADERLWAAAEMLRSDAEGDVEGYRAMFESYMAQNLSLSDFGWVDVSGFALLSVLTDPDHVAGEKAEAVCREKLFASAKELTKMAAESGYGLCMKDRDFVWGSNMVVANRGMFLVLAASLSNGKEKEAYEEAALGTLDYLLGRNALGRSYITGFGEHAYRNPHNRTSACDGIDDPMPGWVSGGPFRTPADPDAIAMIPAGTPPMKCHADVVGSYSTNEITIYWNSPVVFVVAYLRSAVY